MKSTIDRGRSDPHLYADDVVGDTRRSVLLTTTFSVDKGFAWPTPRSPRNVLVTNTGGWILKRAIDEGFEHQSFNERLPRRGQIDRECLACSSFLPGTDATSAYFQRFNRDSTGDDFWCRLERDCYCR